MAIWVAASYIFYRRFPNNYLQPNFYAEDGYVFANNLSHYGFVHTLFTTFNGYYIWGIYILEKIGFLVNTIFFHNEFVNLPRALAVTSYTFLGGVATLPYILFRKYLLPQAILIATLLIIFVPLIGWDYAIIGTIGNLKFAFLFIAFLLLTYRHLMPAGSKKVYLVDLCLLVCAYTNITVYALMPFALLRYWPCLRAREFKAVLRDYTFRSLVGLGVCLLPQLYIVHRDGIPLLPGYLDTAYNSHRTVEIFIYRSYLYGVLFPITKYLNDIIVTVITLVASGFLFVFGRKYRQVLLFGLFAIFMATFLFVIKRTGISDYFLGYKSSGPDQFFYTQNWIFGFLIALSLTQCILLFRQRTIRVGLYILVFAYIGIALAPHAGTYGDNDFMEKTVGNIYSEANADCKTSQKYFNLTIYPTTNLHYSGVSRSQLCTVAAVSYQPETIGLGLLPYHNDYLSLGSNRYPFTQTFQSPANNLNGLEIYFSTFMTRVNASYSLHLMDATCSHEIARVKVKTKSLIDNAFATIMFPAVKHAAGKFYCFTVSPDKTPTAAIAIQLSEPNVYPTGTTTINNKPSNQSIVFALHYR